VDATPIEWDPGALVARTSPLGRYTQPATCWSVAATRSCWNVANESDTVDGHDVWVVSGAPKPGYRAKSRDGAALLKIHGKMWIEKAGYQWVRLEAQTTETISFGWFLAWLNPGAKLSVEQTRINDEVWFPKREYLSGSGRIGLVKRVAEDQEITWSDYKKFRVDSKVITGDR
jgi:hypothetical protein